MGQDMHPYWQCIGYRRNGDPIYLAKGAEDPPTDPPAGYLTQKQVNDMIAAERKTATDKGKQTAAEQMANDLGMTVDEAKKLIAEHKAASDKNLTEAQKARKDADAEKTAAASEKAAAQAEVFATRAERALVRAKIALPSDEDDKDGTKTEAVLSRVARMLDVELTAKPEEITEAVKQLKTTFPALFEGEGEPNEDPPRRLPGTDPKAPPRTKAPSGDALKRGMDRAATKFKKPDPANK